jgi:hypothetical protein
MGTISPVDAIFKGLLAVTNKPLLKTDAIAHASSLKNYCEPIAGFVQEERQAHNECRRAKRH